MALAAATSVSGVDIPLVLVEAGVVLLLLGLLSRLAQRLQTSPVPFYLLVGVTVGLGPGPLEVDPAVIEVGAAIGVVLLLFFIGLEYTGLELVTTLRRQAPAGLVDALANIVPALAIGLLMGLEGAALVALAGIAWASSSGIVARTLEDLGRFGNRETPGVLAILVIEDVGMAAYLPVLTVVLAGGTVAAAVGSVALAIAVVLLALFIAVRGSHHAERIFGAVGGEALVLTMLGMTMIVAGAAELIQVSAAVGAFLVGILVSGRLARRTRAQLEPIRDLFAAIFFVFFGLQIDLAGLAPQGGWILALCLVGIAGKLASGWFVARRARSGPSARLRAGTVLIPRGEFAIVIASLAVAAGVDERIGALTAGYVLVLALAGSLATRFSDPISRRVRDLRRSRQAVPGA